MSAQVVPQKPMLPSRSAEEIESLHQLVQVIDLDAVFTGNLAPFLSRSKIQDRGLDYNTVAILGCQSSGKSTLLNCLFATQFQVMDADTGRRQTTEGVWLGCDESRRTLVMDVEGTDSKERGEEHGNFERKSALFSLALAEVVIVNMWANDVGRYNASNYGLLKTVFEVNLQLFQSDDSPRTLLMFLLRDHVTTPLDKLQDTIRGDMNKIWESITKPRKFAASRIDDFFEFAFESLPHYELKRPEFDAAVDGLRERFCNPDADRFIFKPVYHKQVPADGFAHFAASIWKTISENRDLDLPSEKEMLATYRCDEIADGAFEEFRQRFVPLAARVSNGSILSDFGVTAGRELRATLEQYNAPASRYLPSVCARKRAALQAKVLRSMADTFHALVQLQLKDTVNRFRRDLEHALPKDKASNDFRAVAQSVRSDAVAAFTAFVAAAQVQQQGSEDDAAGADAAATPGGAADGGQVPLHTIVEGEFVHPDGQLIMPSNSQSTLAIREKERRASAVRPVRPAAAPVEPWDVTDVLADLSAQLDAVQEEARAAQLQLLIQSLHAFLDHELAAPVDSLLDTASEDMWPRIATVLEAGVDAVCEQLAEALPGFGVEDDVNADLNQDVISYARQIVLRKADETGKYALLKMQKHFETVFRYDERNIPRVWKQEDDVEAVFVMARDAGLALLMRLAVARLDGSTGPVDTQVDPKDDNDAAIDTSSGDIAIVLDAQARRQLRKQFDAAIEAAFREAKRIQSGVSLETRVPPYMMLLLLVLGWNEIMVLLTNPLYLVLALLVGGGMYVAHSLRMLQPILSGVLLPAINQAAAALQSSVAGAAAAASGAPPPRSTSPAAVADDVRSRRNPDAESKKDR